MATLSGVPGVRRLHWVVAVLLLSIGGCATETSTPSISSSAASSATSKPTPAPTSSFDPADIARWIAFRSTYGLRADLEWVLLAAGDPSSANDFDVPLAPAEINEVARKNRAAQDLVPAVTAYGGRFADFAGVRIDGPRVLILFKSAVDEHQTVLDELFGPGRIDVRAAPYSTADLEVLAAQVVAEQAWFATIRVEFIDAEPWEGAPVVRLRYIAPDRSAEPLITAHFGDPDWLTLRWLGPPPWTGPLGRLVVRIVDPEGRPLPRAADPTCLPTPVETSVRYSAFPRDTDGTRRCVYEQVPAVAWDVEVTWLDANEIKQRIHRRVEVPAGGTGSTTVVIDR
jgi:hypothetical protein